tara:strand:- start:155 stop:295 length:141 start_codon:yes stop_codon:yes gene_type:complete
MKNFKFIFIISSLLVLVIVIATIYVDMPAPDKLEKKTLEVNDVSVK